MASKEDQNIYSDDCVPTGFILGDPDHLNSFQVNSLYTHWQSRQKKGLAPFIIINPGPLHLHVQKKSQKSAKAKGKEKKVYLPVDTTDDEEEEEEFGKVEEDEDEDKVDDDRDEEEDVDKVDDGGVEEEEASTNGDVDMEVEDVDEEMLPSVKFGPPVRKSKKNGNSSRPPVAGPSRKVPPSSPVAGPSRRQGVHFSPVAGPSKHPRNSKKPKEVDENSQNSRRRNGKDKVSNLDKVIKYFQFSLELN